MHQFTAVCMHVSLVMSDTGQVWAIQAVMCLCVAGRGTQREQGHSCVGIADLVSPLRPAASGAVIHTSLDYSTLGALNSSGPT